MRRGVAVAPAAVLYFPARHAVQSDSESLPSVSKYLPAGQLWHAVLEAAPDVGEYLPLLHLLQSASASLP